MKKSPFIVFHLPGAVIGLWFFSLFPVDAATAEINQVPVWERWEQTLVSARDYANPYHDVVLRVIFKGPKEQCITGYGFWDGERNFKIRTAFPSPGKWKWETSCSEQADNGLNKRSGVVRVVTYEGENPLYRHGFLKVSENHRYLTYADETPFLWVGDTPWSAFYQATKSEWESFVDYRCKQKFTVLQVHAATGWTPEKFSGANENIPAFLNKGADIKWNPVYWQSVEQKVQVANDRGMIVFICAMIEPAWKLGGKKRDNLDDVQVFARELAARLAGNFVAWSPTADDIWSPAADECGRMLKEVNARQLVVAHPRFLLEPGMIFCDKDYTDAGGLQTGAGWQYNPYEKEPSKPFLAETASQWAVEWPLALYQRTPIKPVLNLEGPYDGGNLQNAVSKYYAPPYPRRMPRSVGYLSFLSGAFGYTYGVGGVWDWGTQTRNASGGWDFQTALHTSSAFEIQYFAEFFRSIRWWQLQPHHELILNQSVDWLHHMVFAHSENRKFAVAYLPDNPRVIINLSGFPESMTVKWFNPLTGRYIDTLKAISGTDSDIFVKPDGWEDAVLLLSTEN